MTYGELKIYDEFKTEKEPKSVFVKEENRYDGACNSHQLKSVFRDNMFEPTIFSKDYEVIKL